MNEQVLPDDIIDVDAIVGNQNAPKCDDVPPFVCQSLVHEEISMEEALLKRLKETINMRLAWALKLQSMIQHGAENGVKLEECDPAIEQKPFSEAAKGAYEAISSNFSILSPASDTSRPPNLTTHPDSIAHQLALARCNAPPTAQVTTPVNSSVYLLPPRTRHTNRAPPPQTPQYLYILDTLSTPSLLYKLRCPHPSCLRSDFPRLQGLLNHCRIKHGQEYGSHDECIQACAVLVEEEEEGSKIIRDGLEVKGMSASLKRLFEMAVGRGAGVVTGSGADVTMGQHEPTTGSHAAPMEVDSVSSQIEPSSSPSTLLSQTLGIHKDTPALAPFLRIAQRKRCVNVYDDADAVIDIDGDGEGACINMSTAPRQPWRKAYHQRSLLDTAPEADDIIALSYELDASDIAESGRSESKDGSEAQQEKHTDKVADENVSMRSRFHVTARLGISDWSLRVVDDANKGQTHRWMILVQAPAYSIHASTFISSISLLSTSPATFLNVPLPTVNVSSDQSTSSPPFVITGTSNVPFLAALAIEIIGGGPGKTKTLQIEHWVDLEVGKSDRPILGDEQLVDVELDRNTPLLPRRGDEAFLANSSSNTNSKSGTPTSTSNGPASTITTQYDWSADFYVGALGITKRPPLGSRTTTGANGGGNKEGGEEGGLKETSQGGKGARGKGKGAGENEPAYVAQLRALLPRFPMTLRDAVMKSRPTAQLQLPYLLPSSPSHFNAMVWGRKKAIEWGRARALYEAYCALLSASNPIVPQIPQPSTIPPAMSTAPDPAVIISADTASLRTTNAESSSLVEQHQSQTPALSLGDIYHWLETEGHFIRSPKSKAQAADTNKDKDSDKVGKVKIKVKLKGKTHDAGNAPAGVTSMAGMVMDDGTIASGADASASDSSRRETDVYGNQYEYCPLCGVNLLVAGAGAASPLLSSGNQNTGKAKGSGVVSKANATSLNVNTIGSIAATPTHICPMHPSSSDSRISTAEISALPILKPPLLDIAAVRQRCASERNRGKAREYAANPATLISGQCYVQAHDQPDNEQDIYHNANPSQAHSHVLKPERPESQMHLQRQRTMEIQTTIGCVRNGDETQTVHVASHNISSGHNTDTDMDTDVRSGRLENTSDHYPALVSCVDPTLVHAVRRMVDALMRVQRERSRERRQSQSWYPGYGGDPDEGIDSMTLPKEEGPRLVTLPQLKQVESVNDIAPYALLSHLARIYMGKLITDGLNVLNTSSRFTPGNGQSQQQQRSQSSLSTIQSQGRARTNCLTHTQISSLPPPAPVRLLTPAHIFRGLEERARRTEGLDGVLLSVARLGVWVDEAESVSTTK